MLSARTYFYADNAFKTVVKQSLLSVCPESKRYHSPIIRWIYRTSRAGFFFYVVWQPFVQRSFNSKLLKHKNQKLRGFWCKQKGKKLTSNKCLRKQTWLIHLKNEQQRRFNDASPDPVKTHFPTQVHADLCREPTYTLTYPKYAKRKQKA